VFLCTGNHEYYSDVLAWIPHFNRLGLRVLENEHVTIGGEDGFTLAGVYDHYSAAFGHGPDVARALHGRDPNKPVVLLCHQPRDVEKAARNGVNLQLSGHTHGGQIWPVGYFVRLMYGYVAGLYRISDSMHLYINRGTGFWGPGMRLPKPGEVTLIRLKAV
jgi:predicted MPP superfamily phosphohydrolase